MDDVELDILKKGTALAFERCDRIAFMFYFAAFSSTFIQPLSQVMFVSQDRPHYSGISPYLSQPFYSPVDSTTVFGFVIVFLLNLMYSVTVYAAVIASTDIYIGCATQLNTQMRILNHSLRNIPARARRVCGKAAGGFDVSVPDFRDCLLGCLRSNVRHHHAIMRFKEIFDGYVSGLLLYIVAIASLSYASTLYLIMQSSELYESLYDTPWMDADARFARMIGIMMSYNIQPFKLTSMVFRVTASLETFSDVISGMYKIVNVIRSS